MRAVVAWLGVLGLATSPVGADQKPQRIASLTLTADEVLSELVPVERMVAVTAASDESESSYVAGHYPAHIARFRRAGLERLIALNPALVVVSEYTDADFLALLGQSGLKTHRMVGLRSVPGIRQAILDLGRAVGEEEAAARTVQRLDRRLERLAQSLADVERPRVAYWSQPYTAGGDSAISALIECAGARNLSRELGYEGLVPIGAERLFVTKPDVLLVSGDARALRSHPLLAQLEAVKQNRIVDVPHREIVTLSQHVADACWALARRFHPALAGENPP